MGCSSCSKILLIIFFLLSFFSTHIFIVNNNNNTPFNALLFLNLHGPPNDVYRRAGNQEQRIRVLEKLRSLLGLKDFYVGGGGGIGSPFLGYNNDFGSASSPAPTPCPLEASSPSPAPSPHHGYSHPPPHHRHHLVPEAHSKQKKGKSRKVVITAAVVVSAGVGFLLCAFGMFWGCQILKKRRKKTTRTVSIYCTETGNGGTSISRHGGASHSTLKKVNSNPGPDLFYLDTLGAALEPHPPFCSIQNSISLNAITNLNVPNTSLSSKQDSDQKLTKSDVVACDSDRFSSAGEIVSSHEPDVSHSPPESNVIMPETAADSDDESFHSFCNSHSSEVRLSNVSAGSLSEISVTMSPKVPNCSEANENLTPSGKFPPPPPPPPVSSFLHSMNSKSASFPKTTTTKINVSSSTTALQNASSSRNSVSSSESNETPLSELSTSPVNPTKPPNGIPPPPCPPPFPRGRSISLTGPPPPPPLFSQVSPLGKDGVPLPKLKPLHWDKVRATPDRTTVWDKLRSSSFE